MSISEEQFNNIIENTIMDVKSLLKVKGGEYAGSEDRLGNFRRNAKMLDVPVELIWEVYANKHWDAIQTYIRDIIRGEGRQKSEPILGRVEDMIAYLLLFRAILFEAEHNKQSNLR